MISDKFGEIYIKNMNNDILELPTILYGHSDPIHQMRISPFNNTIISADTFGKIKICEFPNIFNFLSVILYKNEDIKYLDFLSNKEIVVLNSENTLHFWSLEDYELKHKHNLNEKDLEIISIIPFDSKFIYIESNKYLAIFERKEGELMKIEEIEKNSEKNTKNFFLNESNNFKIIQVNEEGEILKVITRNK